MKRDEKKKLIQERIITAIIDHLDEKLIDSMTSDEISRWANVSKRTLYQYFQSKKEMYLGVVLHCFKELADVIENQNSKNDSNDPWDEIECIGRMYMKYCLDNTGKAMIMLSFNEMDYIVDYEVWIKKIQEYSNKFELSDYIKRLYEYHGQKPKVSIESLSLYLWAEIQGLSDLILSKRSWIKEYYKIDEEQIIDEHLMLGKQLLLGEDYEKE